MRTDQHLEQKGTFDECWQNSDVVLVAEEKELHVHSTILSLASPVFDKMLNGNFKEAQSKKVHLQGKSFQLVEHMLKLIYPTIDEKIGLLQLYRVLKRIEETIGKSFVIAISS